MRILVTGGGGFLGSSIIKELLKDPTSIVTSFSRYHYPHLEDSGVPCIRGDVRNMADVERALSQGFDAVIHTAALQGEWGRYKDFFEVNYQGTKNLLEGAKACGVSRFVYTSSSSVVIGKDELLGVDEKINYPKKYLSDYAETKSMAERLVLQMNNHKDFLTCSLRPYFMWGPGASGFIYQALQRARLGKLQMIGEGNNLVDSIYVDNAALAHVLALKKLTPESSVCGSAYFIGQEDPINLWSFINQILAILKIEPVIKSMDLKSAYRLGWVMEKTFKVAGILRPAPALTRSMVHELGESHYFSHAKALAELGYRSQISTSEGLSQLFSLREQLKIETSVQS